MWLVDTSVWIAVFRRKNPLELTQHLEFEEIVTCLPVIQEVLQGFRDERSYRIAREALRNLLVASTNERWRQLLSVRGTLNAPSRTSI